MSQKNITQIKPNFIESDFVNVPVFLNTADLLLPFFKNANAKEDRKY